MTDSGSNLARRSVLSSVGRPIHFVSGQFTGQTIRSRLEEIQKANLGRKYARVDRRPLDPPPVILLYMYKVYNTGTDRETEEEFQNYDDIESPGLVCTVDLFPAPSSSKSNLTPTQSPQNYSYNQPSYPASGPSGVSPQLNHDVLGYLPPLSESSDIVTYVGGFPITEDSKCTKSLVGQTFVQPVSIDYKGSKRLMFVFSDLAVKTEGDFILRYRFFDIFPHVQGSDDYVVQAECYGDVFHVYSTKEFPGLPPSTELTKLLSRYGVRLNTRENERKRKSLKGKATELKGDASTVRASGKDKGKSALDKTTDRSTDDDGYASDD